MTVTLSSAIDQVVDAPGFGRSSPVTATEIARLPAGKGFNVARALATLGSRCAAVGLVGKPDARWFAASLRSASENKIEPRLILLASRTRRCLTILDRTSGGEHHLRFESPPLGTADAERLVAQALTYVRKETLVAVCGAAPPGAGTACMITLIRACHARGADVLLDTSGSALAAAIAERPRLLKINAEELAALTGKRVDTARRVVKAVERIRPVLGASARGAVIITRGKAGAILIARRTVLEARARIPTRSIRCTVGCGDAFAAGVLAALNRDRGWRDALRLGVGTAAALATSEIPGMLSRERAALLSRRVTVRSL